MRQAQSRWQFMRMAQKPVAHVVFPAKQQRHHGQDDVVCNVTPMAAPTMLPRSSRVMPIAGSVFSPHSGISPKNIPIAIATAITWSVTKGMKASSYVIT